jgi:hypothetical protein
MPTTQKGLNGPALSHAQMDENFTLVDTNEAAITDLTARVTANEAQEITGELTFGKLTTNNVFSPYVITDTIKGTIQDYPANKNANGDYEKIIYSNTILRYTSGGKLMLTFINNSGDTPYYLTNEYVFSRADSDGNFNVSSPTTVGSAVLLDSITITEVTVGSEVKLEVTLTAADVAPNNSTLTVVIGQITYTSVPILVTVSGY